MKITKDKTPSSRKLDTYIGEGTAFEGNLVSKGNICIYGSVRGLIECQGRVVIGESGKIEADIRANDVTISGKVVGNVIAKGKFEMTSSGVLQGDIKTSRLSMEDGSRFNGHCEMSLDEKPTVKEKTKAESTPSVLTSQEKSKLPSASHD